ncbi:hypothetical protein EDC39_101452 [Geothermobacter ehrlichii]|uniref:VanZ family protein n=1 Tax=Geothermobacter ehrlichii TaxID=213224 RepID=A0A5D3WRR9_9BACT|nr:VanZ family protein [Geothermobacter ehrlichii]TYP00289.1 hypothetical protein EDC39_101452 [Geothermobacter ehrlichii]
MVESVAVKYRGIFRLLALGWMVTILVLALNDAPASVAFFPGQDKLSHALAFGLLTCLWTFAISFSSLRRRLYLAGLASLSYGALVEVAQFLLTTTRQAEWGDLLADLAGVLAAAGMLLVLKRQPEDERSGG